jgi:arginyl-tRNA synthetase
MILKDLKNGLVSALSIIYQLNLSESDLTITSTKKEFEGDYTLVIFPLVKLVKQSPDQIGDAIGKYALDHIDHIVSYNVIKGFLNFTFSEQWWLNLLKNISASPTYGHKANNGEKVLVEFSSPNTNKPLHLGHIRNILLGWSCSQILEANGYEVIKTQIVNDRGIAVCKSMVAWLNYADGTTPTGSGIKSDHFVGDYYVMFEQKFQEEYKAWQITNEGQAIFSTRKDLDQSQDVFFKTYKNTYFNEYSAIGRQAKNMLLDWEAGDTKVRELWALMNAWVYEGFEATYEKLGVHFDKLYFESDTYLLGKEAVSKGLNAGVFYQNDDNSIWVDLSNKGMDQKIVQRSDGTAVYMTQDIGTAQLRYKDFGVSKMIYTVADEQDYHFSVLFEILKRLGEPYADGLFHLSYGMVDLPTGKMKSREGTVVDADDLIDEVIQEAQAASDERGEVVELSDEERKDIISKIGMAALKYFIIKVQAKKRMIFDPKESVDMQGQTGPYIQNAYVRIKSILRKQEVNSLQSNTYNSLVDNEKELLKLLLDYPQVISDAGIHYEPSIIANYCYSLAKEFHRFYHDVRILKAETDDARLFRLSLAQEVAKVLKSGMKLLGIEMPERM